MDMCAGNTSTNTNTNMPDIEALAKSSRVAALQLQTATNSDKKKALHAIHRHLAAHKPEILAANGQDLQTAKKDANLPSTLVKRLDLNAAGDKFQSMLQGILDMAELPDPVGQVTLATQLDKELTLYRMTCPVGVLLVIFEARPEVVVQVSCLAIKSGNAVILKGGKEASHSNQILYKVLSDALAEASIPTIPSSAIQLVSTREAVSDLLLLDKYIDMAIPRGGYDLVKYVKKHATMPVLGHADGLCALYLDESATLEKAIPVIIDSKTSYPAACNSAETLLVHKSCLSTTFPSVASALFTAGVSLRCDESSYNAISSLRQSQPHDESDNHSVSQITRSIPQDYTTEFLDLVIAVKTVSSLSEAILHINTHGSHHTDAIITESQSNAEEFMKKVDAAGVYWNASTRFADGFRYGFGAEIGVSTSKTHARGPVGLEGLVIYKYRMYGNGQASADYGPHGPRHYLHERIKIDENLEEKFVLA
ncbi:glutamate-5-semialdehyde dehydrogenase [Synchytrium endobioticum]|uniref:glutamate-5-semialdehyde dehydrogenase n=1 Tax=Synchytrium endobioticum TaxID=286115 RepID=A0A507DIB5_9FUNG|nr:glutamate-5-semialdehyde dehydrogenase [Synchytrium endobioticum]TPX54442.1 glutamate-5-semialdehyde dehydrogenase [Synchytrium endobioticum]